MISKRKEFNIAIALSALSEYRTVNSDGSITIKSFSTTDDWSSYLSSALTCLGRSQAFLDSVIEKTIHMKQVWTEKDFLSECNRQANILSEKSSLYCVAFPLWPAGQNIRESEISSDCHLSFDASNPTAIRAKVVSERARLYANLSPKYQGVTDHAKELRLAICTVKASSISDAYQTAERLVSTTLGVYSLFLRRGASIIPKNPMKPAGILLIAPFTTVHDEHGTLSSEMFWYDWWPDEPESNTSKLEKWESIVSRADELWAKIKNSFWKEKAELALARYYRAFSTPDTEKAFLELWMLLEFIAGDENVKGEILVNRAATFYSERKKWQQIGKHLQIRRNSISHGKKVDAGDSETILFQMIDLIDPILMNFLINPFEFQNLEEFWSFCDQPIESNIRNRRKYIMDCAAKFRGE